MTTPHIYALGSNGSGQLGIGHADDVSTPTRCVFSPSTHIVPHHEHEHEHEHEHAAIVKKIVAGGNHTLVLTQDGQVYAAGENGDGRCALALDDGETQSLVFCKVVGDLFQGMRVTDVAASWEASFFVLEGRCVVSCGTGSKGELGLGVDVTVAETPRTVLEVGNGGEEIVEIQAAMGHVLVRTSQDRVLGWGAARKGQLGHTLKDERILWTPQTIDVGLESPRRLLAGRDFTVVLGRQNQAVLLGESKSFDSTSVQGIIGVHDDDDEHDDISVASGWSSVYAITDAGATISGVGRNDRGQLPLPSLPKLRALAAGSEHCVAITVDGSVIAWGWGEHGNCGLPVDKRGNVSGRWNAMSMPEEAQVQQVAAGCATSFIICEPPG